MSDISQRDIIKAWLSKGDKTCDCRIYAHRESIIRMLRALWDRQTPEEQRSNSTRKRNCIGFNAFDARKAGKMLRGIRDRDLTIPVAWKAKYMLTKYAGQLAEIKGQR